MTTKRSEMLNHRNHNYHLSKHAIRSKQNLQYWQEEPEKDNKMLAKTKEEKERSSCRVANTNKEPKAREQTVLR